MVPPTLFKFRPMFLVMSLPSSNAFQISRTHFSLMNSKWRSDRKEVTVKVELTYRFFLVNFDDKCSHFYDFLVKQEKLLAAVASNYNKYVKQTEASF